jgi:AraC-like DNA-binding protein
MLGSTISVFSEPDDFRRALQESSYTELLIIEGGVFWARMTKIALHSLRLSSAQERLGRIASIAVPPGLIRVLLPPDRGTLICGGTEVRAGNLVTQCPGDSVHERLPGPCCWREIVVPVRYLARYSRALTGSPTVVPPRVRSWRPPAGDIRQLVALHAAATRVAETHAGKIFGAEAARGLEQELIACLVECLSAGTLETAVAAADRHAVTVARFEQMVSACPDRLPPLATVCAALGVAHRTLRQCCHEHLGMGPSHYLLLRRLQRARDALRRAGSEMATVSGLARQHGFRELGRFAASYRALYGELPSTTLRRSMDG